MFNIFSFIFGLSPCTRIWIPQGWELLPALCTDVSPVANNIRFVKNHPTNLPHATSTSLRFCSWLEICGAAGLGPA